MEKYNELVQLEGFERVTTLIDLIHSRLGFVGFDDLGQLEYEPDEVHASLYDDTAKVLLAEATEALVTLYQHLGQWEFRENPDVIPEWAIKEIQESLDKEDPVYFSEQEAENLMEEFKESVRNKYTDEYSSSSEVLHQDPVVFKEDQKKNIIELGNEMGHDLSGLFDPETSDTEKQSLALLALCLKSQKEHKEGKSRPASEVLAEMRQKRLDSGV